LRRDGRIRPSKPSAARCFWKLLTNHVAPDAFVRRRAELACCTLDSPS
jgi:hypothetical protein